MTSLSITADMAETGVARAMLGISRTVFGERLDLVKRLEEFECLRDSGARFVLLSFERVGEHPASRVHELTPRMWKSLFADSPLRSPLHQIA